MGIKNMSCCFSWAVTWLVGLEILFFGRFGSGHFPQVCAPARADIVESNGKNLPSGATTRLGTVQLRHGNSISCLAFCPNDKWIASGSWDKTASLWELPGGKEIRHFKDNTAEVQSLVISPDGKKIAVGTTSVSMWEVDTDKKLWQTEDLKCCVRGLAFSHDGEVLALGGDNGAVVLLKAISGHEIGRFQGHAGAIASLIYSADDSWLASGSWDKTIRISDVKTGKARYVLQNPGQVMALALSPDGKNLASGSWDLLDKNSPEIRIWSPTEGPNSRSIKLRGNRNPFRQTQEQINSLSFSPDGKGLAAAVDDTIYVFNFATGALSFAHRDTDAFIKVVRYSSNGQLVAYAGTGNTIHFLDAKSGKEKKPTSGHRGEINSVAITADGKRVVSGGLDRRVCVWDAPSGNEMWQHAGFEAPAVSVALSPNGRILATGSDKICLWDTETGKNIREIQRREVTISDVVFSAGGTTLASAGLFGGSICEVATGKEQIRLGWYVTSVSYSPDGMVLATANSFPFQFPLPPGTISLWNAQMGNKLREWEAHEEGISSVVFSPDGRTLASVSGGLAALKPGRVAFWNPQTGQAQKCLSQDLVDVASIAFSYDGRTLATGHQNAVLRLWELATGQERSQLKGHRGAITCMAFSTDGRRFVSGSKDTSLLLWDVKKATSSGEIDIRDAAALTRLWDCLAQLDSKTSYQAIWRLVEAQEASLSLIGKKLKPIGSHDSSHIEELIQKLDDKDFAQRESASKELQKIGEAAAPVLENALAGKVSLEARRRIEEILKSLTGPRRLQATRALEVLELIGNQGAKELLRSLSQGAPKAWLTEEAKASLNRLEKRAASRMN